ncbi:MAG: molecular chaperone HtpG, partial [Candidatus Hodarchaeales archaeon]
MSDESGSEVKTYEFQAEIQRVLDIIINRLYKNQEIFLRELISNSADALNKVKLIQLSSDGEVHDKEADLEIKITADEDEKTITITDTGIGMTREEVITNLGTIAQSGTLHFLEQMNEISEDSNMIGQFGVGFYSAFMVSKKVVVRTRSYKPEAEGVEWASEGSGKFTVKPINKASRGTEVILHLKDDASDFLNKWRLRTVINKYSDFVNFPVIIEGENEGKPINKMVPIWHMADSEVKEEDYKEFYRSISFDFEEPLKRIKISADAPIQFKALLFIPRVRSQQIYTQQADWGLKIYSKKILVQDKSKDSLPEYMRFVRGVIDSEDLPLNVSREVVQTDRTIKRIRKVLVSKILSELKKMANKEKEDYLIFWNAFGPLIKEGITSIETKEDKLVELLRVRTSKSDEWIPLSEYVDRMKDDQEEIYYLISSDLETAKSSSHLDYYIAKDLEVIFFTEPIDSFMLMHLREYKGKNLVAIDQEAPEPVKEEGEDESDSGDDEKKDTSDPLIEKFKAVLGDRVLDVKYSSKLVDNPSRLVGSHGSEFQRVMRYMTDDYTAPKKVLEINKDHVIISRLKDLVESDSDTNKKVDMIIKQLFENHLLEDGNLKTLGEYIKRINA